MMKISKGVEVHHDGDLPARSGLGSSSAFTVGMLNALCGLKRKMISKDELARQAIHVERELLHESVGSQDQIAVAYGGFNKIIFQKDHEFRIDPITLSKERLMQLERHLILLFTGISRFSTKAAAEHIKNVHLNKKSLLLIREFVDQAIDILDSDRDILEFGRLLDESWKLKRSLAKKISNITINSIYEKAQRYGAVGGKLLGAGGGGFMLLFVPPSKQKRFRQGMKEFLEVKFSFENEGSQIIYYNPQNI
jgi:D-glycero-alpha-D-manno-heptose-7-phosphate kinase